MEDYLELPGHGESESLVRDLVPLVDKVVSANVHHQLPLHVLHVVVQRGNEMPAQRRQLNVKTASHNVPNHKNVTLLPSVAEPEPEPVEPKLFEDLEPKPDKI